MKKLVLYILLLSAPYAVHAQFDKLRDSVVQLYGVIMTADSLKAIPLVSVVVKGRNQGTYSNEQGVFSIVVLKGDVIEFSSVGYKPFTLNVQIRLAATSIASFSSWCRMHNTCRQRLSGRDPHGSNSNGIS